MIAGSDPSRAPQPGSAPATSQSLRNAAASLQPELGRPSASPQRLRPGQPPGPVGRGQI